MLHRRFSNIATAALAVLTASALVAVGLGCNGGAKNGANNTNGADAFSILMPEDVAKLPARPDPPKQGPAVSGDTIKIGLVASQNGPLIPWGTDCINGAQLAVDLANAAGGIDGKRIQLVVEDSASLPDVGKSAAEKLISDGVVALLGEVSSGITQPMSQVSFENGIPHLAVGATKTTITDIGKNVFRVCYTDDFQGPVMAYFAYETLNLRNVAIMTDEKQPYSQYLSKTFKAAFQMLGGKIVAEESYESGHTNFTAQLSNLKTKSPEGVFLSGYFTEIGPIVRQAAQSGMSNVKYFGGDGWDSNDLISGGGDAIVGGYFCNHYNEHEDRAEVKDFLTAWAKKYNGGRPGTTMGALGYDGAALMIDAIRRAETKDGPGIIAALENTVDFKGVSGSITLSGMRGNPKKPALVVEVTKTGFRPAKSFEYEEVYDALRKAKSN